MSFYNVEIFRRRGGFHIRLIFIVAITFITNIAVASRITLKNSDVSLNLNACTGRIQSHRKTLTEDLLIRLWEPHDFEFKNKKTVANPFVIKFSAEFTGPGGVRLTVPGFYDGEGTWKVRFSATKAGKWMMTTHSDLPELDGKECRFNCVSNQKINIHGALMVDQANPHQLIYDDGTHFFSSGYECNWLWALDEFDQKLPTINKFLDKLSAFGFNTFLINSYCYDTSWRPAKSEVEDYGPSALYPWAGDNEHPDFSQFNIAYWQHFDQMVNALYQRGMMVHLYFKVYNKKVNWPTNDSPEDDRYYEWIIARYSAYPNLIWDLAKEANNEKSITYKTARLKKIREFDPYHHLLTVHTDVHAYDSGVYDKLVDFRSHQEQSDHLHATTMKQLARNNWPVFNVESGYEYGPKGAGDKTYSHADSPEETARRIWEIQMAGGYNAYYYTYTAWDVIHPNDTPPGYVYLKYFKDFFGSTRYWLLNPSDSLVNNGYCLANTGKEYVVFLNKATTFTINLTQIKTPMKARWYNPYKGIFEDAGIISGGVVKFTPPEKFGTQPVVLHISDAKTKLVSQGNL